MPARWPQKSLVIVGTVAFGLGCLGVSCGGAAEVGTGSTTSVPSEEPESTTSTSTIDPTTTTEATATTPLPPTTTSANVYWGWTVLNPSAGSPERLGAGTREVTADVPVRNSLEMLFNGLNDDERTIGMTTGIPPGTKVLGIARDGATATVDLSTEFASSSGSLDETIRLAQVVFTITQFDEIDRVKFHIEGTAVDPILSHGFVVGQGLTRDSFAEVRASIMIEQPSPGAEVTNPLVVRGESNTFEATVRYAITSGDNDGELMTEGFTTATGGNGTWGTFEVAVDVSDFPSDYQPGPGAIIMWEDSPRDGAPVNVVEVPIVLPER
ncbi:MAG: Gmad2 immunoglobulin-like domain-containing protein [Ilumatobacter sp.]|nr:Gmad2 immunoglobulin-like domain-containing protein [Ilumatobacter sp.]